MSLEKPLSKKEIQKLDELLSSDKMFERMVERAVRGGRKRIERKGRGSGTSKVARRLG